MIQRFKSNQDGNFEVDLINEEDEDFVTEPYTLVPPPVPNWKPVFDFTENKWIETLSDDEIKVKNAGANSLEELKENKKKQLSDTCRDEILSGFECEMLGVIYHISYDMEAQANLQEVYQLFQNKVIETIRWSAILEGEKTRLSLSKPEFEKMFYTSVKHKQCLISKLKDSIEPKIDSATSVEEIEAIKWEDEPSKDMVLKLSKTMDKELGNLAVKTDMSDMALMEIANMMMMGMSE